MKRDKQDDRQPATLFPVLSVLTAAEARPLRIEGVKPIGNYAYGIAFSDGHNTGRFSARPLCTPEEYLIPCLHLGCEVLLPDRPLELSDCSKIAV